MTAPTGIPPLHRSPVARALGSLLASGFSLLQRLRPPRPIHSRGVVLRGEMRWIPDAAPAGVSFVDDAPPGPVPVVARVSRSVGLPAPLPDIIGLALRIDVQAWARRGGEGPDPDDGILERGRTGGRRASLSGATAASRAVADIELASTGWNVPARFALLPRRRAERARLGTLLPFRGARGPVLFIARTSAGRPPATDPRKVTGARDTAWVLTLGHATAVGPWHPFARLELHLDPDQDARGLRFDAVRRPVPGAESYAWVRAARQPSYVRVQLDDAELRTPTDQPAAAGR
ncbi:1-deoxy-D-xylulose 5-phosphate reductoisomerase [Microbacterium testaceum StLB037]|uniref:1-deoxy-D-xylulose 5-phosphate reductoisomerase n=1 Tax=Microbacterium testaceum (strain StLB037) TaxID=979556 RepID=E8NFA1_MICTS|nr:hypothetical protein [Microbacterium testaceum]BAJ75174.1 1-deoxy-D-xylulose 5-phosphate reductoisomerase [Microbacterium testaceum StLB037]